jgi:large subunit ribosomal protein L24
MQKVIRRTLFAEKQAARRLVKRKEKQVRQWANIMRQQQGSVRKLETSQIKAARLARREDLELGPLAPRRDVGDAKETYGALSPDQIRGMELDYRKRDEILESVGGRFLNIVKGDRVVLLEGRDKGKIGKIIDTSPKSGTCTLDGLNMVSRPQTPRRLQS